MQLEPLDKANQWTLSYDGLIGQSAIICNTNQNVLNTPKYLIFLKGGVVYRIEQRWISIFFKAFTLFVAIRFRIILMLVLHIVVSLMQ